ncbi:MAG: M48 family metalloprotease [Bryobacteraceae bacterium]
MEKFLRLLLGFAVLLPAGVCQEQEKECALGKHLSENVKRSATLLDDPAVVAYVDRLAQTVSARCAAGKPVNVGVIVSDEMNGFALPGGFLFVNTGVLRHAGSEAELAGVLAHLIAYKPIRQTAVNYTSTPLIFMGSWLGHAYNVGAGTAVPLGSMEAYRTAVSEADARGLACLDQAGYDPAAYIENLRRLPTPTRASTHPAPAERIEQAQGGMQVLEAKPEYLLSTAEFQEMKRRLIF